MIRLSKMKTVLSVIINATLATPLQVIASHVGVTTDMLRPAAFVYPDSTKLDRMIA